VRNARKGPAKPSAPPTGAEELKEARKLVEDYVHKVLALRRRLDSDLIKVNAAAMSVRYEKKNRDELSRWARKEAAEKVLRTEKVSPEEFRVETSGEGLGRLRYTLKAIDGKLRIDLVQRLCDFCFGKGACPHCEGKGCNDCSKTGLCFVCEGRVWEDYSRCP
jgi:hypothetical protein